MQKMLEAYIDSYDFITILIDKSIDSKEKEFTLLDNKGIELELEILEHVEENNFNKYLVKFIPSIKLYKDYVIKDEMDNTTPLMSGAIIRDSRFEEKFFYDGPLGVEYTKEKTTFRIWSPVAKEIYIELINKENKTERYDLKIKEKGLWEVTVKGDLDSFGYLYFVRVFDTFIKINDPYAIAASANARMNYVVNPDKFYKMKYEKPEFSGEYTDAIIYEASIRDFTQGLDNEYNGTFLGMLDDETDQTEEPRGLKYIASLGVTHLQLLPVFDFGGVDDLDKNSEYNWGYNPVEYFVPSGWYSINPNDPYSRINELLQLVDEAHKLGLRITYDVVFNHVYKHELFAFDNLVPGYFYRIEADGRLSNSSGCGNVIASERLMARRFIKDVLVYFTKVFHASGFRFDLMGLLDVDTLNESYNEIIKYEDKIMVYGEGWNMMNPLPDEKRAHMYNHKLMPHYAFFNDRFRDYVRGSQWNKTNGFALGNIRSNFDLNHLIMGSCIDYYKFDEPTRSINYVECHDNYTFYDYCKYHSGLDEKNIKNAAKLAMELVLISEGIPFIHAGQEFFRTKMGVENSYNSRDKINKIDYARRNKSLANVETLRDLISIRKEYKVFRLSSHVDIENMVHPLDGITTGNSTGIFFEDYETKMILYIKNDYKDSELYSSGYSLIFDGKRRCDIIKNVHIFKQPGIYIFRKDKKLWK